jgi:hypothetical protein
MFKASSFPSALFLSQASDYHFTNQCIVTDPSSTVQATGGRPGRTCPSPTIPDTKAQRIELNFHRVLAVHRPGWYPKQFREDSSEFPGSRLLTELSAWLSPGVEVESIFPKRTASAAPLREIILQQKIQRYPTDARDVVSNITSSTVDSHSVLQD